MPAFFAGFNDPLIAVQFWIARQYANSQSAADIFEMLVQFAYFFA